MERKNRTRLYHGTSSIILNSIIEKGIIPRNQSGVPDFFLDARDNVIYLNMDAKRAFVYGEIANYRFGNSEKPALLIEVEVKTENLIPDESTLARTETVGYVSGIFEKVKDWEDCLVLTGNVAHKGGINPDEILRIYEGLDFKERRLIYLSESFGDVRKRLGLPENLISLSKSTLNQQI